MAENERCDFTMLYVTECAHCQGHKHWEQNTDEDLDFFGLNAPITRNPWFAAKFPGHCSECGSHFTAGGQIAKTSSGYMSRECCG